ncbi:hypothetical protein C8K18_101258 [Paraburkholderia sp. GV068]|nr:hypothetical protein C8K19_101182 [Paraburkholderia sp. GV072]PUB08750.1 hypothetical protein C8K18_101258 [Paraburkholderia sp. GV068]
MPKSARCQVEEKTDTSNPFMNLAIHTPFGIVLDCGETPTQPKYIGLFEFDGRTLSKFTFGSDLSLVAFQADKMSGKDFAQTFIDAYSIPRLEPSENQQYLTYRDTDHGWALDLYQDKSFRVYAITTAAAQSKSFN